MLTTLSTLKTRLAIDQADPQYDVVLTNALRALSARFDKETNRTLARTENATFEFDTRDTELSPPCYPIESITKFETKTSEASGWQEQSPTPEFLIRSGCIISFCPPFSLQPLAFLASLTPAATSSRAPTPRHPPLPPRPFLPTSNKLPSSKSPIGFRIVSTSA
jgi:hypothetical protein